MVDAGQADGLEISVDVAILALLVVVILASPVVMVMLIRQTVTYMTHVQDRSVSAIAESIGNAVTQTVDAALSAVLYPPEAQKEPEPYNQDDDQPAQEGIYTPPWEGEKFDDPLPDPFADRPGAKSVREIPDYTKLNDSGMHSMSSSDHDPKQN